MYNENMPGGQNDDRRSEEQIVMCGHEDRLMHKLAASLIRSLDGEIHRYGKDNMPGVPYFDDFGKKLVWIEPVDCPLFYVTDIATDMIQQCIGRAESIFLVANKLESMCNFYSTMSLSEVSPDSQEGYSVYIDDVDTIQLVGSLSDSTADKLDSFVYKLTQELQDNDVVKSPVLEEQYFGKFTGLSRHDQLVVNYWSCVMQAMLWVIRRQKPYEQIMNHDCSNTWWIKE